MRYPNRATAPIMWIAVALMMVAASCSTSTTVNGSQASGDSGDDAESIAAAPTEPAVEPTVEEPAEPAPTATPPTPEPEPEPEAAPAVEYWGANLSVGDCYNRPPDGGAFVQPTVVSCNELHEEELYGQGQLDSAADEPFPGSDEVAQLVFEFCEPLTLDFVGAIDADVPFLTYALYPAAEEWEAGDRGIGCSAGPPESGEVKIGTVAGGTIDSDDVIVARAPLTDGEATFDDWVVITEAATIDTAGSLTNGQFDLPLRRPFVVGQGLMFNAIDEGAATEDVSTFGLNWETGEVIDLGAILPGQEMASTMTGNGVSVFAARATAEDDWDLWVADDNGARPLADGDGDQQFPTFTPDFARVVYQDNGDIWVIDVDGSNALQLTSGPESDWESTVSPDGSTVVFSSDRSGDEDLWSVSIDGGEAVNLTNHPADDFWPFFSPDGSRIYFSTDRAGGDDRYHIMVMEANGTNQSWFANMNASQGVAVSAEVGARLLESAPTLDERYNYELIGGEPGTTTTWSHPSGRLSLDLPAGWRVSEFVEGIGLIAAPRPSRYMSYWEADGVVVTLQEEVSSDEFFALVEATDAVTSCEAFDGTGGIVAVDEATQGLSINLNCGEDGAVAGVISLYNEADQVGVIIEGQRDNLPDEITDSEMLTAIARSVVWG